MSRCIPYVLDEGTAETQYQAVAICMNYWRDATNDNEKSLRIPIVLYGDIEVKGIEARDVFEAKMKSVQKSNIGEYDAFVQLHWHDISMDDYDALSNGERELEDILMGRPFCCKIRTLEDDGLHTITLIKESMTSLWETLTGSDTIIVEDKDMLPVASPNDVSMALKLDMGSDDGSFWFSHENGYDYMELLWNGTAIIDDDIITFKSDSDTPLLNKSITFYNDECEPCSKTDTTDTPSWGDIPKTKENFPNKSQFIVQRGDTWSDYKLPYRLKSGVIHCGGVKSAYSASHGARSGESMNLTAEEKERIIKSI